MTVHLLLGILHEDQTVATRVGTGAFETIRKELEHHAPPRSARLSMPENMSLSKDSHRALTFAAQEADALEHKLIEPQHLVLGLLRIKTSTAAKLLVAYGMDYKGYWELVRHPPLEPPSDSAVETVSLQPTIQTLRKLVETAADRLRVADSYGDQQMDSKPWTRKEALGHLIDWAMAHQQWFARALMEPKLTTAGYPDEKAVAIQDYAHFSWPETVDLWVALNRLLIHVLERVPEGKLEVPCRIGIAEPIPLVELVDRYVEHCEGIVAQILANPF
jgi:hypothetical protein